MKIRWTTRTLRLRLDDLETTALLSGSTLRESIHFPGGHWSVELSAAQEPEFGMRDGVLRITLDPHELSTLMDANQEGIEREGRPRLMVEKDRLPEHGSGA